MGKTHLSLYLSDLLAKQGAMVRLLDARDLLQGVELLQSKRLSAKSVVIVDDLHLALPSLNKIEGESATAGAFVSFVELLRASRSKVIFLSSLPISSFEGNPHIHSRLAASTSFTLKFPDERHFVSVVGSMLVQRGISLSKRSVAYLGKVLPKDFAQIENYIANLDYLSSILGEDITMQTIKDAV
jgi:chromosomal replication initiation ATPase DnaA